MEPVNRSVGTYTITTDKRLMNVHDIHHWLSAHSYWLKDVPFHIVESTFSNSFCIAVLHGDKQVGYARLITDYTIFGYLADVYILEEHRGQGLSKAMMAVLLDLEWVKGLMRTMLATTDAHGLYHQFGFTECKHPEKLMERTRPATFATTQP